MRLEGFQRFVAEFGAAAERPPGMLMTMVHAERRAGGIGERRLLADVEIERRLRDLDGRGAHGIKRLQTGHDLACGKSLDLKLVVGGISHVFRKGLCRTEDGVERFWKARGQAPLDLGHRLGDRGCGNQRRGAGHGAALEERTAFHNHSFKLQIDWLTAKRVAGPFDRTIANFRAGVEALPCPPPGGA